MAQCQLSPFVPGNPGFYEEFPASKTKMLMVTSCVFTIVYIGCLRLYTLPGAIVFRTAAFIHRVSVQFDIGFQTIKFDQPHLSNLDSGDFSSS